MKLEEVVKLNKPIVLVFGRLCSGKGTYCAPYEEQGYLHITTSDVVRGLSGAQTRDKLQHTKDFDEAIGERMVELIYEHKMVIIDGIRQNKIVDRIVDEFGDNVQMIWLEVPADIRKERFRKRGAAKDDQSFEDAERGDTNLGLDDVEAKYRPQSRVVHNY